MQILQIHPLNTLSSLYGQLRKLWMGGVVVILVGMLSWILAGFMPRLGGVTIAILLGVLVGNLLPDITHLNEGARFAEKQLLPVAIALLGVELQLVTLVSLGMGAIWIIAATIGTSLLVSLLLGKALGYSREFSLLIGAGNGICGSSAVAATSTAIGANQEDTGISISVVNLLGTIGIFLMPVLVSLLALNETQGGMLVGGTLQAVGQVVAAGFSISDGAGGVATAVKMGRVLMLGPVVILIHSWMRQRPDLEDKAKARIKVPPFIIAFFMLSVLASTHLLPTIAVEYLTVIGKYLLIVAMVGIGMRISLRTLYRSGIKALLFGAVVSAAQIVMTLLLILLFVH